MQSQTQQRKRSDISSVRYTLHWAHFEQGRAEPDPEKRAQKTTATAIPRHDHIPGAKFIPSLHRQQHHSEPYWKVMSIGTGLNIKKQALQPSSN